MLPVMVGTAPGPQVYIQAAMVVLRLHCTLLQHTLKCVESIEAETFPHLIILAKVLKFEPLKTIVTVLHENGREPSNFRPLPCLQPIVPRATKPYPRLPRTRALT